MEVPSEADCRVHRSIMQGALATVESMYVRYIANATVA
jgi:hypothetical protein